MAFARHEMLLAAAVTPMLAEVAPRFTFEQLEPRRLMSAGALDPTFGGGGHVSVFGEFLVGGSTVVQADGKVVVSGGVQAERGADDVAVIYRFNRDGTPDATFGAGGRVTLDLSDRSDRGDGMAVLPDGKLLVTAAVGWDAVLLRLHVDGSLDTSFGQGGVVRLAVGGTGDAGGCGPMHVAVLPSGRILVAGTAPDGRGGQDLAA